MKKRRINKKHLYIILSIIIISVFSLTIAYAVLSSTLTISGSSEISGSSWEITINKVNLDERFPNSEWLTGELTKTGKHNENALTVGNAKLISSGIISNSSISDIQVSLSIPGDLVVPVFEVTNNGSIPAVIDSGTENEITIISSSNNADDIQLISKYFSSTILMLYTNKVDKGSDLSDAYFEGLLCPGESIYVIMINEFSESAPSVSSSDVTISNIGCTFNFVQADKNTCSN